MIFKFIVTVSIVISSAAGAYVYAESVKDAKLKKDLIAEQVVIRHSIEEIHQDKQEGFILVSEAKKIIENQAIKLGTIEGRMTALAPKSAQKVRQQNDNLAKKLSDLSNLTQIYELQNSLFETKILTPEDLNQTAKLKEDVTLDEIEAIAIKVKENPQATLVKEQSEAVIEFAIKQFETKNAVKEWLLKNDQQYSEKNVQILSDLVKQVVPESEQAGFEDALRKFEKGLAEKVAKEKVAQEKAEKERIALENVNRAVATASQTTITEIEQNGYSQTSAPNQDVAAGVTSTPAANGQAAPAIPDAAPVQEARTDGFNFKGNHFGIQSFSGLGAVPQWTPYIYQWSEDPSHYLVEKASSAGSAIWQLGVGDTIQLDGQTYTIFHVMRHVPNDDSAYPTLKSQGATVTWQTCESASANSDLAIWFAR
ncbi:hypothetical protein [Enterococcus sp. DIV1314a]|uniref:hypothetical protein n=1 Tax=Enterococcus sp. DIV1314a TaxID=2774660 RepID=UPI003F2957BD